MEDHRSAIVRSASRPDGPNDRSDVLLGEWRELNN